MPVNRLASGLVLCVVVFVSMVIAGCSSQPNCSSSGPSSLVCIQQMSTRLASDGHTFSVMVWVVNATAKDEVTSTWWELSPSGPGASWRRSVYQSEARTLQLKAHAPTRLEWTEEAVVPDGFYEVSAWVHLRTSGGTFEHSDGTTSPARFVHFDHPGPRAVRHQPPNGGRIGDISGAMASVPRLQKLNYQVAVTNQSSRLQQLSLRWIVSTKLTGWLHRWWEEPTAAAGPQQALMLQPGQSGTVVIQASIPAGLNLASGRYDVRLELDAGSVKTDVVLVYDPPNLDWNPRPRTEVDRYSAPTGPAALESVAAATRVDGGSSQTVNLLVRNLTGTVQTCRAWWLLGDVDVTAPTLRQPGNNKVAALRLDPWQAVMVPSREVVPTAPGTYTVSGWVHCQTPAGVFTQSDALLLRQQTTVLGKTA